MRTAGLTAPLRSPGTPLRLGSTAVQPEYRVRRGASVGAWAGRGSPGQRRASGGACRGMPDNRAAGRPVRPPWYGDQCCKSSSGAALRWRLFCKAQNTAPDMATSAIAARLSAPLRDSRVTGGRAGPKFAARRRVAAGLIGSVRRRCRSSLTTASRSVREIQRSADVRHQAATRPAPNQPVDEYNILPPRDN